MTIAITHDEYGTVYNAIERELHPDLPPITPDPLVAKVAWAVLRAQGRLEARSATSKRT
jgi:hypothetical protein